MDFEFKNSYDFYDLVNILRVLRNPGGCPWDREQTHESIRRDFIEETYEAIEAIDTKNPELLCEELGDVLLQVVFHSQIEEDAGGFTINEVCDGICKKLIIRHPHVFSDVIADTPDKVLENWDSIKMQTKSQSTQAQAMDSVSHALPSLIRADKVQNKARKCGFDWSDVSGALDKLSEEIEELKSAIAQQDDKASAEELGDVLFSAVNVSRFIGVDAEQALGDACDKFISRFSQVEQLAGERGVDMKSSTLEELDALWDEAKKA
ncbi:MAG: nucleoside triphosphate pyrophosphohydrolase [Clostridia bacterium]|nr:nucleoside triphosphate pyrophosphohydrolase [Clostridia bacterium]